MSRLQLLLKIGVGMADSFNVATACDDDDDDRAHKVILSA